MSWIHNVLNILIPLGSHANFSENAEYPYPKPLVEIAGKPMIQKVIENLSQISGEKRFIFILREEDCRRFHLDTTVRLLVGDDAIVKSNFTPIQGRGTCNPRKRPCNDHHDLPYFFHAVHYQAQTFLRN